MMDNIFRKLLNKVVLGQANAGSFVILACLLLVGLFWIYRRKGNIFAGMLWCYFCGLFYLTFLNRQTGFGGEVRLGLKFGNPFGDYGEKVQFVYVFLNVLLFVPLGWLLLHMKWVKNVFTAAGICLLTTGLIELLQFLTTRGYFELTDIVCNFAGGIAGIVLGLLTKRIVGKKCTEMENREDNVD